MTKYSYIYPVRNRADLLRRGLQSLVAMEYSQDEYEVVIADYMSEDDIYSVLYEFTGLINMKYLRIDPRRYESHPIYFKNGKCNPAFAQNLAVREAEGEFIILTSPEIVHWSKNLINLDKIEDLKNKFVYGKVIEKAEKEVFDIHFPFGIIDKICIGTPLCDWDIKGARSVTLYFIGVLSRELFLRYGGIDEYYMTGIAYDDEDFGNRMEKVPDLKLEFHKEVCGVHLTHDRSYQDQDAIKSNREYIAIKHKDGWDKHLIANEQLKNKEGKKIKPGDANSLICRAQFWRY